MATVETQDTLYQDALKIVKQLDEHLEKGTRHYWHTGGYLLTHLGQVVWAILNDELMTDEDVRTLAAAVGNEG